MLPFVVIHPYPLIGIALSLLKMFKLISIQDVFSGGFVKAFNVAVLKGLSSLNEDQINFTVRVFTPIFENLRNKLRAIFKSNGAW